jgi:hypothetical protein
MDDSRLNVRALSKETSTPEDKIEITPGMIEAGAATLCGFETLTADESYLAETVYRAMRRAAPRMNL